MMHLLMASPLCLLLSNTKSIGYVEMTRISDNKGTIFLRNSKRNALIFTCKRVQRGMDLPEGE